MITANLPGFMAEKSFSLYNVVYIQRKQEIQSSNVPFITPQWSGKSALCGVLAGLILAGQIELAFVAANVCAYAATTGGGGRPHYRSCDSNWLAECQAAGYDSATCWRNCPPANIHRYPRVNRHPKKG
jgi:hypothetical protein